MKNYLDRLTTNGTTNKLVQLSSEIWGVWLQGPEYNYKVLMYRDLVLGYQLVLYHQRSHINIDINLKYSFQGISVSGLINNKANEIFIQLCSDALREYLENPGHDLVSMILPRHEQKAQVELDEFIKGVTK